MRQVFQVASFGAIGVCATITHVGLAWFMLEAVSIDPYLANLLGAAAAFLVSLFGNARFSFGVRERIFSYAGRYAVVSGISMLLTTIELQLVLHFGLPSYVYVAIVLLTVPPATFLAAKLWAFRDVDPTRARI